MKSKDKKRPYIWNERSVIISALRKSFRRYPAFKEVRDRCKREWFQQCKNGNKRRRVNFECELCKKQVSSKQFVVDHIEPVVSLAEGFIDYNLYAKRLFCSVDNLQGLCYTCNKEKCASEAKTRAKIRREKNEPSKNAKRPA